MNMFRELTRMRANSDVRNAHFILCVASMIIEQKAPPGAISSSASSSASQQSRKRKHKDVEVVVVE
jgi:hypothetical protein